MIECLESIGCNDPALAIAMTSSLGITLLVGLGVLTWIWAGDTLQHWWKELIEVL